MQNLLIKFALIKSLFDQGEDYLDSFWPIIACSIDDEDKLKIVNIQQKVKARYGLTIPIPIHTLNSILAKSIKKSLMLYDPIRQEYSLTANGKDLKSKMENENTIKRNINSLIVSINIFLQKKGVKKSDNDVELLVNSFILKNIEPLIIYFNPRCSSEFKVDGFSEEERYLVEYLQMVNKEKPQEYSILYDMILGSIILSSLYSQPEKKIDPLTSSSDISKHNYIYLDTNFLISLLQLHEDDYYQPAKELYDILLNLNYKLRIFSFTLDELTYKIKNYKNVYHKFAENIPVDSIYSNLKRKGWRPADAVLYCGKIEDTLSAMGIEIDNTFSVNLSSYKPKNISINDVLLRESNYESTYPLNHDCAAIEKIIELRGREVWNFEHFSYIFLTSSVRLSRINSLNMNHHFKGSVPEIILDRVLTNILWLKNPKLKLPLNVIISTHIRGSLVNPLIWNRFYEILTKLKSEEKITIDDISILIFDSRTESDLKTFNQENMDQLNETSILNRVEEIRSNQAQNISQIHQDFEKQLLKKDEEFLQKIDESAIDYKRELLEKEVELQKLESERIQEVQGLKQKISDIKEKNAKRDAYFVIQIIRAILIIVVGYLVYTFHSTITENFIYIPIIGLIIVILGISLPKLWDRFETGLSRKILSLRKDI